MNARKHFAAALALSMAAFCGAFADGHLAEAFACLWMGLAAGRVWKKAYTLQKP